MHAAAIGERTRTERPACETILPAGRGERALVHNWRAKLRRQSGGERDEPVRFALVEPLVPSPPPGWALELVLSTGEHLRIGPGVEETALRVAIEALRRPVRP